MQKKISKTRIQMAFTGPRPHYETREIGPYIIWGITNEMNVVLFLSSDPKNSV